jgi:endonuclease YncB( thermonuclease family)
MAADWAVVLSKEVASFQLILGTRFRDSELRKLTQSNTPPAVVAAAQTAEMCRTALDRTLVGLMQPYGDRAGLADDGFVVTETIGGDSRGVTLRRTHYRFRCSSRSSSDAGAPPGAAEALAAPRSPDAPQPAPPSAPTTTQLPQKFFMATATRVLDGRTIEVQTMDGAVQIVRYAGLVIAKPAAATARNRELVEGKTVRVEPVGLDADGGVVADVFSEGRLASARLTAQQLGWFVPEPAGDRASSKPPGGASGAGSGAAGPARRDGAAR